MIRTKVGLRLIHLTCSLATLLLVSSICWAQSDTARIEGTVTDSSGAIVVGAKVIAENVGTGIKTQTETNADGVYVLTPLRIGTYRLEITATGFRKVSKPDVTLQVDQVAKIDIALEAGSVDEVVQVTGGAPLVESSQSSVGQVITGRDIAELPLNGRNFTQLATLSPGVSRGTLGGNADGSQGNAETFRQGDTGSAALSVNGLREQNNNFQLDGIDNNESVVNTIVFFPPVEALQEFKVITNVAPAEYGRAGGAVVNAVIKSGTNDFHGSAFEFIRNSALDARPTFSPNKPLFIRNQFGFTFGGPIIKDKTFFFADFQGLRQRLPIEAGNLITVPTAQMRNGDFSQLLDPNFTGLGQPITIYNPNTGQPFPHNIINIPLNPTAVKYLNSYPLPDLDRARQNFFVKRLQRQSFDDGDVRIDHRVSDKDSVFGRFSIANDGENDPGRIPGFQAGFGAGTNEVDARSIAANYTRTFSATVVNEFRFGWVQDNTQFLPVGFG
ncbi:MAG TPA: carboxypeptidase regulatory-like domain-containing protein, partial [Blastocatellia bacterium]|nr:carboxypeptidase regulatory-like domain-containing protein [Blastocatellia bacterium]